MPYNTIQQAKDNRMRVLRFVCDFENECGCGPSIDWIVYGIAMRRITLFNYLRRLIGDGLLTVKIFRDPEVGKGHGSGTALYYLYTSTDKAREVLEREA